ncbi:MAG: helix-turn-helix transcriptional regulator [Actinomycetota bacterium]|nr:helix-turn-helix transcriptional regulator [Actinomycetota bacterium]MDI6821291.1 helix-turn-helix transcriptional regulator [Actinomycetota bacterium]
MYYDNEIGLRLRNVRESKRLSRKDVEKLTSGEFKESILAMYESGRRRICASRLKRIADFYGVPVSFLLGETFTPQPSQSYDIEAMLMSDPKYSEEERELLLHVIDIIKAKRRAEGKE